MNSSTVRKSGLAVSAAAGFALVAIGVPLAIAAPTAAPPSDGQGYVNSTARCTAPDTAVIFGTTDTSRVAICETASGEYQYRGVRVSDGAKLIAAATQTAGNTFVVKYDGATYTVTPQALSVTINGNTFRTETWADYHGPQAPASSTTEQHLNFVDNVGHRIRNGDSHHVGIFSAVDIVGSKDVRSTLDLGCAAATAVARRGGRQHVRYWLVPDGDGLTPDGDGLALTNPGSWR